MIVALKGLVMHITDFFDLLKINKYEASSWMVTFLSVVLLDVDIGLFVGLAASILIITIKDQNVEIISLSKLNNKSSYIDGCLVKHDEDSIAANDASIFKIQSSLYSVNADAFKKNLQKVLNHSSTASSNSMKKKKNQKENSRVQEEDTDKNVEFLVTQHFILDFSAVNYIDSTGFKALLEV